MLKDNDLLKNGIQTIPIPHSCPMMQTTRRVTGSKEQNLWMNQAFLFSSVLLSCMDHFLSVDPPYISEAKGTGVPVGQKGTLQCEASAVPSAEFQWFKDDKRYCSLLHQPLLRFLITDSWNLIPGKSSLLTSYGGGGMKASLSKLRKAQLGFQCHLLYCHLSNSKTER